MKGRKVPLAETVIEDGGHGATVILPNGKRIEASVQSGLLPDEYIHTDASYAYSAQPVEDLNLLRIHNHDGRARAIDTKSITSGSVTVYFRDVESQLIHHINEADAVLGCVAWLTSKAILSALAEKDPVVLVVQKEDFLRPDLTSGKGWARELRNRYDALSCTWERIELGLHLSTFHDPTIQPVRCIGNHNKTKRPAFPRMHHKFIVFCKEGTDAEIQPDWYGSRYLQPYAVWTGSFNFTENAGRSLENALFITDLEIVRAYVAEWENIVSLSEPLDWESDWVAPEWRIGT